MAYAIPDCRTVPSCQPASVSDIGDLTNAEPAGTSVNVTLRGDARGDPRRSLLVELRKAELRWKD